MRTNSPRMEARSFPHFAARMTVFIPKSTTANEHGWIIRSPDALRPLTLCNCDCKIFTTAICYGLHKYSAKWVHPSQRCVAARQMTDNIFEVETTAGDLDVEVVQREPTSAYPLKGLDAPLRRAMIEAHNLTHLPAAPWCEISVQARGKSDWHTRVKYDSEILCVQMDCQFISGVAVWCPEAHAKAAVLTMVDMDTGYVGVMMVSGKSPDNFMVRSTASFWTS